MSRPSSFMIVLLLLGVLSACSGAQSPAALPSAAPTPAATEPAPSVQSPAAPPSVAPAPAATEPAEIAEPDANLTIRLAGSDRGYPQPYTHDPRGPGSFNMFLIFDGLLEKDEQGLIPWLAQAYSLSEDGKTYTFTLQEGVKWHDGEPFTADDVKFTFEYFAENKPVRNDLFLNGEPFIESIEVVNDYELAVTVKQPNATLLGRLGVTRIIPEHIWKDIENPTEFIGPESIIGTGPYMLVEYIKEQGAYQFVAFPDFWGPKQRVTTIEHVPVSDPVLAFENGEIDFAQISPDLVARFEGKSDYTIIIDPPFNGARLLFNMTGELADKTLRQAIAYAINQEELIANVARGAGVPGNAGYIPLRHPMVNPDAKHYSYDPNKARELLDGKTYAFTLSTAEGDVRVAELVKVYLEAVGIQVEIQAADTKTNDQRVNTGDYELIIQSVGGYGGDPDYLREIFRTKDASQSVSAAALPGYSNPELDTLADQQAFELDLAKRKALIFQLQDLIAEDLPIYTLYNKTAFSVYRPATYDGWMYMFDHQWVYHSKLSYLTR